MELPNFTRPLYGVDEHSIRWFRIQPPRIKLNRVFSLTRPAYMQIYWNKRTRLHKKRVQLPEDWFGTPTWPPFHCFGTPIWPPWRHVKTLYKIDEVWNSANSLSKWRFWFVVIQKFCYYGNVTWRLLLSIWFVLRNKPTNQCQANLELSEKRSFRMKMMSSSLSLSCEKS